MADDNDDDATVTMTTVAKRCTTWRMCN